MPFSENTHFPMFTHNGFSVYSNEVNGILNTESSVIICNEAVRLWLLWWYAGIKAIVVSLAQHLKYQPLK